MINKMGKQPKGEGFWTYADYQTAKGEKALSVGVQVRDMPHLPSQVFPQEAKRDALYGAELLGEVLQQMAAELRVQRHQVVGLLDRRKVRDVCLALQTGDDVMSLRPYVRRTSQPKMPSVAIAASAGVGEVNGHKDYIGKVSRLALTVGWACEVVGAEVHAHLLEGMSDWRIKPSREAGNHPYHQVTLAYALMTPARPTPLQTFAVAMDRNNWYGSGFRSLYQRDPLAKWWAKALDGDCNGNWGGAYLSATGGHGVQWARQVTGADIVVSIGNLQDAASADLALSVETAPKDVVRELAKMIRVKLAGS